MSLVLATISQSAKSIASRNNFGTAWTPSVDSWVYFVVRLSGLNGAAASLTLDIEIASSSLIYPADDLRYTVTKRTATATRAELRIGPVIVLAGESVQPYVTSTNASDTAVAGTIKVIDQTTADIATINGDFDSVAGLLSAGQSYQNYGVFGANIVSSNEGAIDTTTFVPGTFPPNFTSLAITPSGQVTFSNTTIATVTNLTNAPTSGDFTAAMKTSLNAATPTVTLATTQPNYAPAKAGDAMALTTAERTATGTAVWATTTRTITGGTITANNDKTGYTLTQGFPANFSSMLISVGGAVTVGTNGDKTGYVLTQAFPLNFSNLAITNAGAVTTGSAASNGSIY